MRQILTIYFRLYLDSWYLKRNLHIRMKENNYSRKSKKQKEVMVKIRVKRMKMGRRDLLYSTNALCFLACNFAC